MSKRRRTDRVLLLIGIALLAIAACICAVLLLGDRAEEKRNAEAVSYFEEVIPQRRTGIKDGRSVTIMPSMTFGGKDYSAILEAPASGVKLPVRSVWEQNTARRTPCRFDGSPYDGTLVIGGADREGQFAFLTSADLGDEILLTDMTGEEFRYTVRKMKRTKNADAASLTGEECDLVLFTRLQGPEKTYLLLLCDLK